MTTAFVCSHCGREHAGLSCDWGYKLPDEVHALADEQRTGITARRHHEILQRLGHFDRS